MIPLILIILGFTQKNDVILKYQSEGIIITGNITKIKIQNVSYKDKQSFNINSDKRTIVYATIKLINLSDKNKIVNLNNCYLSFDNIRSSKVYIDSYIDYIVKDKEIKQNETVSENVYWVFDFDLSNKDLGNIKLILNKPEGS
jgi:hypothetical protein